MLTQLFILVNNFLKTILLTFKYTGLRILLLKAPSFKQSRKETTMGRSSREYEEFVEQQEQAQLLAQELAWAEMADDAVTQGKLGM
jgi:hypothetical protein